MGIKVLPSDEMRSIMWRYSERFDLQMLIQSARSVARSVVARLVAEKERNNHEWTDKKASLLKALDEAQITSFFIPPEFGGYIEGPKNLASALVAFELAWVDGGAATCSLAGNLALEPIHERGTREQKKRYMGLAVPPKSGEKRPHFRGSFVLTEPIPFVGVETGMLSGKVSVLEWGDEPILKVEKRGRFITNMAFSNFATVAVESDDPRIKGSCMVIIEEKDEGVFDRGSTTLKLVHQLSSTGDPIFSVKVPANRIVGGYKIKDGVIIPNHDHGDVIGAVFKRTRVTVGLMTAAKLLSSIEPIIRYHRTRFRGGDVTEGNPRYELGIQQKEDPLHRLSMIWAMGEAAASLGFAAARIFDELDTLEKIKNEYFEKKLISGTRAELKELMHLQKSLVNDFGKREYKELDDLEKYVFIDSLANVLCPACKLWNTGVGANMMREAVSLMGGYGITEDCPGFLGQKWMDAQLEATYEGPEAVQRRQLSITMINELFLAQLSSWADELEKIDIDDIGSKLLSSAIRLWVYTIRALQINKDCNGDKIYTSSRQSVAFPLADSLSYLLASYYQIKDVVELKEKGGASISESLDETVRFFADLCFIQAARASSETIKILTEIYCGYMPNPENVFFEMVRDVQKKFKSLDLAKSRTAKALTEIVIPEALDYPM